MESRKTNSHYFIENNRNLLKFFASKNPWRTLVFLLPVVAVIICRMIVENFIYSFGYLILSLIFALIYWSFIEYLIHRFYFHWKPKNEFIRSITGSFHLFHHQHPQDSEVITSGWVTGLVGVTFHSSIFYILSLGNVKFTLASTLFLALVYFYYEWIHYLVHDRLQTNSFLKFLQDFHLTHHKEAFVNYGQITPIWDIVFKTYKKPLFASEHLALKKFIFNLKDEAK